MQNRYTWVVESKPLSPIEQSIARVSDTGITGVFLQMLDGTMLKYHVYNREIGWSLTGLERVSSAELL